MKNFDVCFSSQTKGNQMGFNQISAESPEDAFQKFIIGKSHSDFDVVVVGVSSFFGSILTIPVSFPNPLYRPDEIGNNNSEELDINQLNEFQVDKSKNNNSEELDVNQLNEFQPDASLYSGVLKIKQYKVMTQKDKWFSQKFDPEKLEQALNAYAKEGWVVKSICTAQIAGLGGAREELIVVFEK